MQLYQDLEVYITGIDISSAFDTINRQKLINELNKFLDESECCTFEKHNERNPGRR